jgi:hypothetical protein
MELLTIDMPDINALIPALSFDRFALRRLARVRLAESFTVEPDVSRPAESAQPPLKAHTAF